MKKSFIWAFVALAFAACTNPDMNGNDTPIHSGEIETSYIAINLSASDITRAQTGYDDGTEAERRVHHADFFFFDGEGNPFNVTGNPATAPGGGVNHLHAATITFTADTNNGDDISDSSNPVLLLETYKGQYPSQIVAVLNWSPDPNTAYSLDNLKSELVGLYGSADAEGYFIMSNAVYAQGTTEVYATPLTIDNIQSDETAAAEHPVTIYVERVAAKVTVKANAKYDLDKEVDYTPLSSSTTVTGGAYAKILGWDLYRDNTKSYLLKNIDADWTDAELGLAWNEAPWYRSFWATSLAAPTDDQINGSTPYAAGATAYIGENTTADNTKVIIKAQLVNGDDKPLEIAVWNNVEYIDEVNDESERAKSLRIAVANTLKNTYYAKSGDDYTSIAPEDLQCVAGGTDGAPADVKANEVYFQLSDGNAKDWHKLVNGEFVPVATDANTDPNSTNAMNAALKSVPKAVLYTNGETFYYVDIKHLGAKDTAAEFGIVRNHAYDITINSIKGYGSPVYIGNAFINYPETPEQNTYVSAKINILSWRLVSQEVDIQPNN